MLVVVCTQNRSNAVAKMIPRIIGYVLVRDSMYSKVSTLGSTSISAMAPGLH